MTPRRPPPAALFLPILMLICGCPDPNASGPQIVHQRDVAMEKAEKLAKEVDRLQRELAARQRRIDALLALGDKRLEKLYLVQRVRLGSGTGGVDLDDKAGDDAVKVYLEPIDQHGSVIKAPGEVTIQLYDLAAPAGKNLAGEYRFDLDATAKAWSSGFLAYHYRFTCRWKPAPPAHDQVTVRAEFLDYLTGKKHTAQTVCKVRPPVRPSTAPAKK